ncbi:MAG TPA: hypothetical protein VG097_09700 [Gemmata sp.]|jgi:cytochrome c556|nr:hypothetical protein [Gemmata sp.]
MLRKLLKATLASSLGFMMVLLAFSAAATIDDKKDEKVPTIKEIMTKGHKGTDAYIAKIKTAAKDGKWDDAKEYAKTLAFFGENLGKNKPPKGDAESWEKLTKKYADNTKAVSKGVEDQDAKAVGKGLGDITGSCMECHKAHR